MSASYDRYLEDLAERRAPAERKAEQLLREGNFADAEAAITAVDPSRYGGVAAAKMYRRYLEEVVAEGVTEANRAHAETVFQHALRTAVWAYPEPHMQMEADNYESGRAKDRAELVGILGRDPGDA